MIRPVLLLTLLTIAAPAAAQYAPRFHNESDSGGHSGADYGATRRYSGADYGVTYAPPLWRFTYYPAMPQASQRAAGYSY